MTKEIREIASPARSLRAVMFDLGGTLVDYYTSAEWSAVFEECLKTARECLVDRGMQVPDGATLEKNANAIREEERQRIRVREDWQVWPMEERLVRVFFGEGPVPDSALMGQICRAFLTPIFGKARVIPGTLAVLDGLRSRGIPMAIVTNLPWGSPPEPWIEEVRRHGLDKYAPVIVTCRDAGWRKPDRRIFALACDRLEVRPDSCVFVGDEPVWDCEGAETAGIRPILFDPAGQHAGKGKKTIRTLSELISLV